jgi:2-C-methyl-D-erythritol 4-phosphate cytidylyltransferase
MFSAILLSGGKGSRMKSDLPKQYLPFLNKPLILHSFLTLISSPSIEEIVVVCDPSYQAFFLEQGSTKPIHFALPGKERQDSVFNGLQKLSPQTKWVCVHDGARPLLFGKDLEAVLEAGKTHGAATLAVPVKTTIKEGDEQGFVKKTLDRSKLWDIQTPQVVSYGLLQEGFAIASKQNQVVTDDVSLAELVGHPVKLVPGSYSNIKITTQEDWAIAEALMRNFRA